MHFALYTCQMHLRSGQTLSHCQLPVAILNFQRLWHRSCTCKAPQDRPRLSLPYVVPRFGVDYTKLDSLSLSLLHEHHEKNKWHTNGRMAPAKHALPALPRFWTVATAHHALEPHIWRVAGSCCRNLWWLRSETKKNQMNQKHSETVSAAEMWDNMRTFRKNVLVRSSGISLHRPRNFNSCYLFSKPLPLLAHGC